MSAIRFALSVLALSAAGSAFAGGGPYPEPFLSEGDSVKSRSEVVAEMQEARRLGLLTVGEEDVLVATAEQEAQIAQAVRRARDEIHFASRSRNSRR